MQRILLVFNFENSLGDRGCPLVTAHHPPPSSHPLHPPPPPSPAAGAAAAHSPCGRDVSERHVAARLVGAGQPDSGAAAGGRGRGGAAAVAGHEGVHLQRAGAWPPVRRRGLHQQWGPQQLRLRHWEDR